MKKVQAGHDRWRRAGMIAAVAVIGLPVAFVAAEDPSSYSPVVVKENFDDTMARMVTAKPAVMKRQMDLLEERYDMSDRPARGVTMSGGKAI